MERSASKVDRTPSVKGGLNPGLPAARIPNPASETQGLDLSKVEPTLLASFDPVAQKYLAEGNYLKFFITVIPTHGEVPQQVLDILPYFAWTKDNAVHRRVQEFYSENSENPAVNPNALTESRYNYIMNAGFASRFLPPEWIEEFCDDESTTSYNKLSRQGKNLKPFVFSLQNLAGHRIEIEKSIFVQQHTTGQIVTLVTVADEFLKTMPYWKLGPLPNRSTVYALYYIGTKLLYKGRIRASLERPVYIGKSVSDASNQLLILKDKRSTLNPADFAVRVIMIDNRHYLSCVQGLLVQHYDPIWNSRRVGLNFGKIKKEEDNLWIGYHIIQHPKAIKLIDEVVSAAFQDEGEDGKCMQQ